MLCRAGSVSSLPTSQERQGVWQSCISDLQRVTRLDSEVAPSASCAAIFIQCQLLINKVSASAFSSLDRDFVYNNVFDYLLEL